MSDAGAGVNLELAYPKALQRVAEVLRTRSDAALACHVSPDGDALGSTLGFLHLAEQAGMSVTAGWPEPFAVAHHYRSVPGLDRAVSSAAFPAEPTCMVTFDCGSLGRLGELRSSAMYAREHGELIVLDHHRTNDCYGTINAINPSYAATAVVVRELARLLDWPLTNHAAWCLYVGLVTDTGRFQYASVTPEVFTLAEELTSFGLPVPRICRELFDEHRFSYLQLAAHALARAELDQTLGLVSSVVTEADFARFGVTYGEAEGLIDWVRTAAEADVACVLKESQGCVHVSLRSVDVFDVGSVAMALGGGGHRLAAGFSSTESASDVLRAVKREIARVREAQ
jgi:bifunctional oligoribonuclease and PAP phosphatase NrnA